MRLPTLLLKTLLRRGIAVWLFVRLAALMVIAVAQAMAGGAGTPDDIAVNPVSTIVVAAAVVLADLHRRKELMLLNNLGITTSRSVFIGSMPAFVFEAVLALIP